MGERHAWLHTDTSRAICRDDPPHGNRMGLTDSPSHLRL